jgi:hypothetical protein
MANEVDSTQELVMTWDGIGFTNLASARYNPGVVLSVVQYKNEIYVGGTFDSIGGVAATNIARWDGSKWNALSTEILDNGIFKLFPHKGKLYVGGLFLQAGNTYSPGIVAWDGTKWEAVKGGLYASPGNNPPRVYTVGAYRGQLIAAGNVLSFAGPGEIDLLMLNGDQWEVPHGWENGFFTSILSLHVFQDELYVGGVFSEYRDGPGNGIVKWDGETWQALGPGLHRGAWVENMVEYKNELYVVGPFDSAGGVAASMVAKWDGHRWCNLGISDFTGVVTDLVIWNDELYIAGTFITIDGDSMNHLAKWTGITTDTSCGPIIFAYPDTSAQQGNELVIYPNPVTSSLSIRDETNPGLDFDVRIFDLRGRLLMDRKAVEQDDRIDISRLARGIYCIEIRNSARGIKKVFRFEVIR